MVRCAFAEDGFVPSVFLRGKAILRQGNVHISKTPRYDQLDFQTPVVFRIRVVRALPV
jgi:hypothetical protein